LGFSSAISHLPYAWNAAVQLVEMTTSVSHIPGTGQLIAEWSRDIILKAAIQILNTFIIAKSEHSILAKMQF